MARETRGEEPAFLDDPEDYLPEDEEISAEAADLSEAEALRAEVADLKIGRAHV